MKKAVLSCVIFAVLVTGMTVFPASPEKSETDSCELFRAVDAWLDEMPDITAWFVPDSYFAAFLRGRLRSRGLNVPRDVSILAFHDDEDSRASPGLTCFNADARRLGKIAARRIHTALSRNRAPLSMKISVHVLDRGSTGPAPR